MIRFPSMVWSGEDLFQFIYSIHILSNPYALMWLKENNQALGSLSLDTNLIHENPLLGPSFFPMQSS